MRTCVITGASSGIGRSIALALACDERFDRLILVGRRRAELEKTVHLIHSVKETKVDIVQSDLSLLSDVPKLVEKIIGIDSGICGLVNCSGYTEPAPFLDTTLENLETTFKVNFFSPFILIREIAKHMSSCKGEVCKIVNIASTAGSSARPGWSTYAASKAALISLSRTLSAELSACGIKVYCVSPGRCATPLRRILAPAEDQTKIMQPEMVGKFVSSLFSPDEKCLDGQDIIVRMLSN